MAQARSVRNLNLNLPASRGGSTSLDEMFYDLSADEYAGKKDSVKYKGPGNSVVEASYASSKISSKGKGLSSGTAYAKRKRG